MLFSRAYNGVSITSVGKATIVFAKAFASLESKRPSLSCRIVEVTYFALLFLIRSLNMLYLEGDTARCPSLALRQLFLSTLYHWFSATSVELYLTLSRECQSLSKVCAVELLRPPFYLYVSPYIPTLLSVEINRHPQVP